MKASFLSLALSAMAIIVAPQAQGAMLSFDLTSDFCSGGCGSSPFGAVTLDEKSSTSVEVTVTLAPNVFVPTGAGEALGFNVSGSAITSITDITTGFTQSGSYSKGSIGSFAYSIDCSGCGNGGSNPLPGPLVFTVNHSSGLLASDFHCE
jgi:hypothetical protein